MRLKVLFSDDTVLPIKLKNKLLRDLSNKNSSTRAAGKTNVRHESSQTPFNILF